MSSDPKGSFEDEPLIIDMSYFLLSLKRYGKIVGVSALVCMFLASIYYVAPIPKKYRSEAKLLFNSLQAPSVVTDITTIRDLWAGRARTANPYKTQEDLMTSRNLAENLKKKLNKQGIKITEKNPEDIFRKIVIPKHVQDTELINVSADADSPKQARLIVNAYVDSYIEMLNDVSINPVRQARRAFEKQLVQANLEFSELNQRIEEYQKEFDIVDINAESQRKVAQLEDLNSDIRQLTASLASQKAEVNQILGQLKLKKNSDIQHIIESVAGGQDSLLSELQSELNKAVSEYEVKALTYASTNPEMMKLEHKIGVLKTQITNQQIQSVGQSFPSKSLIIKDGLRGDMVSRLVQKDAEQSAIQTRLASRTQQVSALKKEMMGLPKQQLDYARLLLDKKNKENVLNRLQEKLSEINIQESAIQKGLIIVDEPSLPTEPVQPSPWAMIPMAGLVGMLLSSLGVVAYTLKSPPGVSPFYLETAMRIPVLSTVPWLEESDWALGRSRNTLDIITHAATPEFIKAYQDLALKLRVKGDMEKKHTLVVSSLTQDADRPNMLANMAYCLAQSGENVVLVDTNLKSPSLHRIFDHPLDYDKGLVELINGLSERVFKNTQTQPQDLLPLVQSAVTASNIHPQLSYINAGATLENTFEFLNTKGFALLVKTLASHYDWVLLESPPFLTGPEASILLRHTDGLLLFVEQQANESQVRAVRKAVSELGSSILGCVPRTPQ